MTSKDKLHALPKCPVCGVQMAQLFFHDGTPDDLWECPNRCKAAEDQHVRIKQFPPWSNFLYDSGRFLPEDAKVNRATGLSLCAVCGKQLYDHPNYRYPWGDNSAVKDCKGKYWHL